MLVQHTWHSDRVRSLLKMSLAAGLSWYLASLVSPHPTPYFAPLAVVIVFQATIAETAAKAWYRVAGILGGVSVALLVSHWFQTGAVTIAAAVLVEAALCAALRLHPAIASQVGVTTVMVLAFSTTPHYAQYRIVESFIGGVVAVAVNVLLVPPNGVAAAEQRVVGVVDLLAGTLLSLSRAAPGAGETVVQSVTRESAEQMRRAVQAVQGAGSSVRLNPFARNGRARVAELGAVLVELEKVAVQVRGIARGLADLPRETDLHRIGLDEALQGTSACLTAFRHAVECPSYEKARDLEAAIARACMSQANCLSHLKRAESLTELRDLGAVLADVDRILSEVRLERWHRDGEIAVQRPVALGHD